MGALTVLAGDRGSGKTMALIVNFLDSSCREIRFAHNLFGGIIAKSDIGQHQAATGS